MTSSSKIFPTHPKSHSPGKTPPLPSKSSSSSKTPSFRLRKTPVIASLGSALQDIFLIDRDDFVSGRLGKKSLFTSIEIGTKVDIDQIHYSLGGGAVNSAVTFARAGYKTYLLSSLGTDPAALSIRNLSRQEGIIHKYSATSPQNTGCSIILLDQHSGERTILTHRGASQNFSALSPKILKKLRPDWLYATTLQGDFPTLHAFFVLARSLQTKIMFNPGKKELASPTDLLPLLPYVDILLLNHSEATLLASALAPPSPTPAPPSTTNPTPSQSTTSPVDSSPSPQSPLSLLTKLSNCATMVIITSGNSGGILSYSQNSTPTNPHQPPPTLTNLSTAPSAPSAQPPVDPSLTLSSQTTSPPTFLSFGLYADVPVVDTTGAGDAFGSGFLASFAKDHDLTSALTFASANSTAVIQHLGANPHSLRLRSFRPHPFPITPIP